MVVELVAGEAEDGEVIWVAGFEGLVQLLEAFELGGEAAFRGCVYDEDDLAFEAGEGEGLALFCWRRCQSVVALICASVASL